MESYNIAELISYAKKYLEDSYVPYSMCPVGACVLTKQGLLYGACSVENVNFSSSIDAGKLAVLKAVSEGDSEIVALCIYCNKNNELPYPTGECLQTLREFANKVQIIVANNFQSEEFSLFELLPHRFENS